MFTASDILNHLVLLFPQVKSELDFNNHYELTISVVLSAQTTDILVNKATKTLFIAYPNFEALSQALVKDVLSHIHFLGLANTKAKNIVALSQKLMTDYQGLLPCDFDYLISLPGIGRKSANVILSEGFNVPRIAVDTHVLRVANRLGFVKTENPLVVEEKLMQLYDAKDWHSLHLRLVFFGRYFCKAKTPNCPKCPFVSFCKYEKKILNG
ncbi:MAG: endonuclease III [Bacilli bacterium]